MKVDYQQLDSNWVIFGFCYKDEEIWRRNSQDRMEDKDLVLEMLFWRILQEKLNGGIKYKLEIYIYV